MLVTALSGRCMLDEEIIDECVSCELLLRNNEYLHLKSEADQKTIEKQKNAILKLRTKNEELLSVISELKNEVTLKTFKLDSMIKNIRMLNNGTSMLDEILEVGKSARDVTRIGFDYGAATKQNKSTSVTFVPAGYEDDCTMSRTEPQHCSKPQESLNKPKYVLWKCT